VRNVVERETKLEAPADFVLPDLSGLGGARALPVEEVPLDAVYFDTPDLRLARSGISVRHRIGDATGWTVKLPEGGPGHTMTRRELNYGGGPGAVPAAVTALLSASLRSAPLAPVARLRTRRCVLQLVGPDGERLAEVVDDDVVAERLPAAARAGGDPWEGLDGPADMRFRELEVETDERAGAGLHRKLVRALLRAGASEQDEQLPKLVRALGAPALEPPDLVEPKLRKRSTAADAVRAAVTHSLLRILRHDPGVRLGGDPEDVHQMRVGARRLRSDLKTFKPLLDDEWRKGLQNELRWLGGELGAVRDADVLLKRLRAQVDALPARDRQQGAALIGTLERQRERARRALLAPLRSERYAALIDRLMDAARAPRTLPDADERAADVLPRLVRKPWKRLRKAASGLGASSPDEELHQVRIRAKQARYAAEAVAPVAGKAAARHAKTIADLQDVLGDHQDAVVAEQWLRENSRAGALVAGELLADQWEDQEATRAAWPKAWRKARRKKLRGWLRAAASR
jgi:CHAD domain-containing protein